MFIFFGAVVGFLVGGSFGRYFSFSSACTGLLIGAFIGFMLQWSVKKRIKKALNPLREEIRTLQASLDKLQTNQTSAPFGELDLNTNKLDALTPTAENSDLETQVSTAVNVAPPNILPTASQTTPTTTFAQQATQQTVQQTPSPISILFQKIRDWFLGGNTLVRVGVIVLFFGASLLVKLAIDYELLSVEMRLIGVAVGAIIMLAFGWRLRLRRRAYALTLQGGAIAILYLDVFAAFRIFDLLPPVVAFAFLVAMTVFLVLLALLQNSQELAVLAICGGFLAPIITSTGRGNHIILFSYYVLLNAGVMALAWFKAWRLLNVLSFFFIVGVGILWGARSYRDEYLFSTVPFVAIFFVMFVTTSVMFARARVQEKEKYQYYVDTSLVFAMPVIAFGIQYALVRDIEFGMTFSVLFAGLVYLLSAWALYQRRFIGVLLTESCLALAIVFISLAVPFALNAQATSGIWALEGAALIWLGLHQKRLFTRWFGIALLLSAVVSYFLHFEDIVSSYWYYERISDAWYKETLSLFLLAIAYFITSLFWERQQINTKPWEKIIPLPALSWALGGLFWMLMLYWWIDKQEALPYRYRLTVYLAALTFSIILLVRIGHHLRWQAASLAAFTLLPLMIIIYFYFPGNTHASTYGTPYFLANPLYAGAWLSWLLAFIAHYFLLYKEKERLQCIAPFWHSAGLILLAIILARACSIALDWLIDGAPLWSTLPWGLVPALCLFMLAQEKLYRMWPFGAAVSAYRDYTGGVLTIWLAGWLIMTSLAKTGMASPLMYLPLFNPLDIAQIIVLIVLPTWYFYMMRHASVGHQSSDTVRTAFWGIFGAISFLVVNAMLLRCLHHIAHVPFSWRGMMNSMLVQVSLSLFWTILAFSLMIAAKVSMRRILWLVGAGLLIAVLIKLFLIDLSRLSGMLRITSFIGVGILLLLMGYFVPLPPRRHDSPVITKNESAP